jgi:acetolactate synthase-1/2/3 large subunit
VETHFPVVGDVRESLKRIFKHLKTKDRQFWLNELKEQARKHPLWYPQDGLRAQYVLERICHFSQGKAIVTTDVGQHQMWTAQFYRFLEPRHFLTSGGLGTMGYGLPAAIGASVARPGEDVWCITGDGSIMMNVQEFVTAKRLKLPIRIAVMNNGFLGMVRQWQEMFWQEHYSHTLLNDSPDFVEVAKAFGCYGLRCEKREDVDQVIQESYKHKDAPILLDFRVEREENVYPMVPAGGSLEDIMHYPQDVEVI